MAGPNFGVHHNSGAFADLNGDGRSEFVAYVYGFDVCGSGGCRTVVLTPIGNGYRLVAEIPISHPPIVLRRGKSHGWRNLAVFVAGGGILPGYMAELRFDGRTYPENPTVAPARELGRRARGRVLVSDLPNERSDWPSVFPDERRKRIPGELQQPN